MMMTEKYGTALSVLSPGAQSFSFGIVAYSTYSARSEKSCAFNRRAHIGKMFANFHNHRGIRLGVIFR